MEIPCKNCILIPICRYKYYENIITGCRPISEYLRVYRDRDHLSTKLFKSLHNTHTRRVKKLVKTIRPKNWRLLPSSSDVGFRIDILEDKENLVHWGFTFF